MAACFVRGVLIDLSGTLHVENRVISGSVEALKKLRSTGLAIRFVTNTSKESKTTLLTRLTALGLDIEADEVFTSLSAAQCIVKKNSYRPLLLLEVDAAKDFEGVSTDNPNAVVVGLSPNSFCYQTLNKAFRLVLEGCPLIAIHKAHYYKREDGLALGPGPFVVALEYATSVKAQIIGKPEPSFFTEALTDMALPPENTVMIGDDYQNDIMGAQNIGIKGILVQTGKYREGDERQVNPPPFAVAKDFSSAVDFIMKLLLM